MTGHKMVDDPLSFENDLRLTHVKKVLFFRFILVLIVVLKAVRESLVSTIRLQSKSLCANVAEISDNNQQDLVLSAGQMSQ